MMHNTISQHLSVRNTVNHQNKEICVVWENKIIFVRIFRDGEEGTMSCGVGLCFFDLLINF